MPKLNVIKFNYTIKGDDQKNFDVTLLVENQQKGVDLIIRRLGGRAIRLNSLSLVGEIHAIDDSIIDFLINSNPKIKKYKEKISKNENLIQQYEHDLTETQKMLDESKRQPTISSKDIAQALKTKKVYVCDICGYETESIQGLKIHKTKNHTEQVKPIEE
jgi:hypothetical protein